MERELLTFPAWERYTVLSHHIQNMSIRDKRVVFATVRSLREPSGDLFFPHFGFTFSEFAVWHVLSDTRRQKNAA